MAAQVEAHRLEAPRRRQAKRNQERGTLAAVGRTAIEAPRPLHARPRAPRTRRERALRRAGRSGVSEIPLICGLFTSPPASDTIYLLRRLEPGNSTCLTAHSKFRHS